ncbi:MAG: PAS domain S-box protein [Gemmatimonadales bacterium]|nr:PAS domain S-box protein [Gemmatimonadales bacterium]
MLSAIFWMSAVARLAASVWAFRAWYRLRDWRVGVFAGMAVLDLALQFRPGRAAWDPTPSRAIVLVIVTGTLILAIHVVTRLIELERSSAALAEQREEDFRLLYESAADAILVATPDRRYAHANARGLELLGYTLQELQARRIDDVIEESGAPEYRERLSQLREGERMESTRRLRRKDGSLISVEIAGRRLADGRLMAVVRDISRRKAAEEALEAKDRTLSQLVSSYPGVIYHGTLNGTWEMDYVTDGCVELTGYTAEELQYNGVPALVGIVHPDDRGWLLQKCEAAIAARLSCRNEYRIIAKGGEVRWVSEQAEGAFDASGVLVSVSGYVSDITERKRAEAAVRRSERAMALAQRVALLGSWRWDAARDELLGSAELNRIHGFAPDRGLPSPPEYLSLVHPDDRSVVAESLSVVGRGEQGPDIHFRIVRADGVERHLHSSYVIERDAGGRLLGAHGVVQDVTEQWRTLEALRASEEHYRLLFEHAGEAVTVIDRDRRVHAVNARMLEWIGRPKERVIGRRVVDNLGPDDAAVALAQLDMVFSTGTPLETEATLDLPGGRRHLRRQVRPVIVGGEVRYAITLETDTTDRRALETALQESADRARRLLATTQDGFVLADDRGIIVEVNAAYAAMTGYTAEELVGREIRSLEGELGEAEVEARIAEMVRAGGARFTTHHRRKDGRLLPLQVSTTILQQQDGPLVAAFVRDISEERAREELLESSRRQLRALAAKLEAVREEERTGVAREIHDELGQGLTGLKLDVAWIRDQLPARQRAARERAGATLQEVDRLIDSVRALAARLRPAILDDLGLVPAIEWQAGRLFARAAISVTTDLDLPGSVDPDVATTIFRTFQEAATNVVRHAQATQVAVTLREAGDVIELRVTDDGVGYTGPSAADEGHLGLMGMRERANAAGGTFEIVTRPAGGTEVTIRVPRSPRRDPT